MTGEAYVTDPSHPLAVPSTAASKAKYPQYYSGTEPPFRPFWALRPTTAFAWTLEGFPRGATRWRFAERGLVSSGDLALEDDEP